MFAPSALKSVAKRLPVIRDVVSERDRLRGDVRQLVSERDRLHRDFGQFMSEHRKLHREHEQLVLKCAELRQESAESANKRDELRRQLDGLIPAYDKLVAECGLHPPGHFHSPIPSFAEIRRDDKLFGAVPRDIPGVDLHEAEQVELLERLSAYYPSLPFPERKSEALRYCFENPAYSYSDGILLYCMIRHLKPRRVIEIGSGFSSALMLDTNELFFDGALDFTFIEPNPARLMSLTKETDRDRIFVIPRRLQEVEFDVFQQLEANDILFIDSTHVSKLDSDVNRIFFFLLPFLSRGVYVHFHDVHYPFEYPRDWFEMGRAWNETYLLRAFLQYNDAFRIVLMNTFLEHFHEDWFRKRMPLCLKNRGGSIWLRKE